MAEATAPLANRCLTQDIDLLALVSEPAAFDLLAACCGAELNPANHPHFVQLLESVVDRAGLFDAAEHHGLIPLLFEQASVYPERMPAAMLDQLRARYEGTSRRALWFANELTQVLEHLQSMEVEAIAHKGPALALALYGDVTRRQFRDLDLLVRSEDVKKTKSALAKLGYEPGMQLSPREERSYLSSGYEYIFHSPLGRNLLEVQWNILPRFYSVDFNVGDLFARSRGLTTGETTWRTLSSEDLLLVLCVHAAKHVWAQLSWLRDIAHLAKDKNLDWGVVCCEARRLGIKRILALSLGLANHLFRVEFEGCADLKGFDPILEEVPGIIRRDAAYDVESFSYFRLMMRVRERHRDQLRFAWRLLVTPGINEWQIVRLPHGLSPIYRVVRLGRLIGRLSTAH